MREKLVSSLKLVIFSLLPLAVLLGITETGLRLAGLSWAASDQGWGKQFDPVLGWALEPGFRRHWFDWDSNDPGKTDPHWRREIRINSMGFRGGEIERNKNAGSFRIIAMGDSVTFGWGVEADDAFAGRLGALLARRPDGRRYEVINAGVPGYSSRQGVLLLRHALLDLEPDLLLVLYGWNDHYLAAFPDRVMLENQSALLNGLGGLATRFRVFQGVIRLVAWLGEPSRAERVPRVPPGEMRANIEELIALARERGARVVLLTVPSNALAGQVSDWTLDKHEPGGDRDTFIALHRELNATIRAVAEDEGVLFVDIAETIRRLSVEEDARLFYRPEQSTDDVHPNESGHAVIAEQIEGALTHGVLKAEPEAASATVQGVP